jgi:RNA polymerase sigma factor (sigma-70 family)
VEELRSLLARTLAGDLDAFGEVVGRFQDMAFGYAYACLGDFHFAQDAAQDAFIAAYLELPKLRELDRFPGWFRRIVHKHCDRLQRRRKSAASLEHAAKVPSQESGPTEAAERRELREQVLAAIRGLPESHRLVTTLFYIDGYSVREVADFLEVPVGTVKRRLHDSRQQLKERMVQMVAKELQASKPSADFRSLVQKALALQEEGKFGEAVRLHQSALEVINEEAEYPGTLGDTYYRLSQAYHKLGEDSQLAQGIVSGLPSSPPPEMASEVLERLNRAAHAFLAADQPERSVKVADHMLEIAKKLEGSPGARFWRSEALSWHWLAAAKQKDQTEADRLMREIHDNLQAYEEEAGARTAGAASNNTHLRRWFREALGDAYHNLAVHIAIHSGKKDKAEGLRLMRRAAELRQCGSTEACLAQWTLSVEGDRKAALTELKRAAEDFRKHHGLKYLRQAFETADDFEPVRTDPEFLAVLKE